MSRMYILNIILLGSPPATYPPLLTLFTEAHQQQLVARPNGECHQYLSLAGTLAGAEYTSGVCVTGAAQLAAVEPIFTIQNPLRAPGASSTRTPVWNCSVAATPWHMPTARGLRFHRNRPGAKQNPNIATARRSSRRITVDRGSAAIKYIVRRRLPPSRMDIFKVVISDGCASDRSLRERTIADPSSRARRQ